jgi:hypothetical protein
MTLKGTQAGILSQRRPEAYLENGEVFIIIFLETLSQ